MHIVCLGTGGTAVCLVYNFILLLPMLTNYFNFINIALIHFFQAKMNQDFFAPTTVEDHTKINARFGDILNLNVE